MKVLNILTKIIISSFIMALLISTIVFAQENKTKIEVEDVSASGGETVDVPINITDNLGICGATISIAYDNKLKLNSITAGEALASLTMTKPGDLTANPINVLWDGVESDSTNGVILTLTFEVPNNIGEYPVNISYDTGDIMNGNLEPVDVEIQNGKIVVESIESTYDCATQGHKGGTATCTSLAQCEICKAFYGEYDLNNHTGNVITKNIKAATCMEDGYTGDKYCDACNNLIESGRKEDKLEHVFINYVSDENATIEADGTKTAYCEYRCGVTDTITDVGSRLLSKCEIEGHKGGTATCVKKAICEVCNKEYGELDHSNHVGDTEVRNAKEPTCIEEGYSGDIYCCDCDAIIEKGSTIATKAHLFTNYIDDENPSELEVGTKTAQCDYGCGTTDTISVDYDCGTSGHRGGLATCIEKARCALCNNLYGEKDSLNHVGGNRIVDAIDAKCEEEGYSGDIYCEACNELIESGHTIKALGHSFTNYSSDGNATTEADGTKTAVCDNGCGKRNTIEDKGSKLVFTEAEKNIEKVVNIGNKQVTVSIDTDGGVANGDILIPTGKKIKLAKKTVITKDGFTFMGWYINGKKVAALSEKQVTGDKVSIIAKWKENTYSIKYIVKAPNKAKITGKPIKQKGILYSQKIKLGDKLYAEDKQGKKYVIDSWKSADGRNYQPGEEVDMLAGKTKTDKKCVLTAEWIPVE